MRRRVMVEVEMFKGSMRLRRGSTVLSPFYYESAPSGRAQSPAGVQGVKLFVAAFSGILLQRTLYANLPGVDTLVL